MNKTTSIWTVSIAALCLIFSVQGVSWAVSGPGSLLEASTGSATTRSVTRDPVPRCGGMTLEVRPGTQWDLGSTGIAHGSQLPTGNYLGLQVLHRCSDNQSECVTNADCVSGSCDPTCDCVGDNNCEVAGPVGGKRCVTTLAQCASNADCSAGVPCAPMFGPPVPLSSGGTPVCLVNLLEGAVTGTADVGTGDLQLAWNLRSRVFLGITLDKPCPRCGDPGQNPRLGDVFTCSGGQFEGASCTVHGVSADFGGTSYDCPPRLDSNVSGPGLALRFPDVTTGTTTKTAKLPCAALPFRSNPLNAPSYPGKCLDNNVACASNADCKRCTGDSSVACASNGDCTGKGVCAQAPNQPISCGFWCSCGFCNNNPGLPCMETSDCPSGQTCQVGTGTGTQPNGPQQRPNDCSADQFICGELQDGECATTTTGRCSLQPYRFCSEGSDPCGDNNAGTCILSPRSCFGPRITRTGAPSPMGAHCAEGQPDTCTTNADCPRCSTDTAVTCTLDEDCPASGTCGQTPCLSDTLAPEAVALMCIPGTSSSSINSVGGFTGPGTVRLDGFLEVCRCGEGNPICNQSCAEGAYCGNGVVDPGEACDGTPDCQPDCTLVPVTTTTVTTTTTTLDPSNCRDWDLTFSLDSASAVVVALQYSTDYSAAGGTFEGSGSAVVCENLVSGSLYAPNDEESVSQLSIGTIQVSGISAPTQLARCRFVTDVSGPPSEANLPITILDASDANADPVTVGVSVAIAPADTCGGAGTCGDGIVQFGEQCDGGPCCSADCTFAAQGASCEDGDLCSTNDICNGYGYCQAGNAVNCDDQNPCTVEQCVPATGTCDVQPLRRTTCQKPLASDLLMTTGPAKKIQWKWGKGEAAVNCGWVGSPQAYTDYDVCLFDTTTGGALVAAGHFHLPASQRWSMKSGCRWSYTDSERSFDGIDKLRISPMEDGEASLRFSARGSATPLPQPVAFDRFLHMDSNVVIQLINDQGVCWESEFTSAQQNSGERFRAKF